MNGLAEPYLGVQGQEIAAKNAKAAQNQSAPLGGNAWFGNQEVFAFSRSSALLSISSALGAGAPSSS